MQTLQIGHAQLSRVRVGSVTHVRLSGAIDETFAPDAASADCMGHVLVDVGRIERISSFGVRKWVDFVSKLPAGSVGLYILHAPPIIVDQLNLVEGFAGIAKVLSVLAPYRCETCNDERVRLIDVVDDKEAIQSGAAPAHRCPVCDNALEFADVPEEFFEFVKNQNLGPIDAPIMRYVKSLRPNPETMEEERSVTKMIVEDVTYFRLGHKVGTDLNVRRLSAGLEGKVVFDFGGTTVVEPKGVEKLLQALDTVAQHAQALLWRVPPVVLDAMSSAGLIPNATLATLYVPCDCANCGNKSFERMGAQEYLADVLAGRPIERQCQICGGIARLLHLKNVLPFLKAAKLGTSLTEVENTEWRAFSQYLSTPSQTNTTPTSTKEFGGANLRMQVIRRLGQGGMAEVFLARQQGVKGFEKYVVVKKILPQFAQSPDFVEMLFSEARANARLTHPNVVQTFDVGMMDGVAYITMEYVRGPDLKKLIVALKRKGVKLPIAHALRIVAETAAGLHYAHSYVDPAGTPHPMVHRDVSPHNVLISLDGAIKLSDFGIAKVQGEAEQTQAGVLKGKIAYISPEAVSGAKLDARNDVFALGIVLFELLTGRLPFKRENEAATLRAIVREPTPDPVAVDPSIPQDVAAIVMWALEKDLSRRIQSAAQFREAVESVMAKHGMNSSPSGVAEFFKEQLAQELAEFGPISSSSNTGSSSNVAMRLTPTGSPPTYRPPTPPPSRPAPPVQAQPPARLPSQPAGAQVRPPTTDAPVSESTSSVSIEVMGGEMLAPELSEEPPTRSIPPPQPEALRQPAPRPPEPRPQSNGAYHGATHQPAAPALPRPPAPRPQPQPAFVAQPQAQAPSQRVGKGKLLAIIAPVLLLIVAAGGFIASGRSVGQALKVTNLAPGESLFVNGVQVDPQKRGPEGESLIVAVSKEGRLTRFGTASSERELDSLSLVAASGLPSPDQKAVLHVASTPTGCPVILGGKQLPSLTPVELMIQAGVETDVAISCPSTPLWQARILGIPGQRITVTAQFTKD